MSATLWTRGEQLRRLPTEQPFHAWYELVHAENDDSLDINRKVGDVVYERTNHRIVCGSPTRDQGMLRLLCVTDPDARYSRGQIGDLMPRRLAIEWRQGGSYAGDEEIPVVRKVYRLHALRLLDPDVATQSYAQLMAGR